MQSDASKQENSNKKYIDISLGKIITVVIILALVIGDIWLGVYAYKLKNKENINNNEIENNVNI